MIRPGGDYRISNYLLWEMAYSEFYFTKTYWPDFSKKLLEDIINNFNYLDFAYLLFMITCFIRFIQIKKQELKGKL